MSQWGKERLIIEGATIIRVIAHISTNAFEPAGPDKCVDHLLLLDCVDDKGHALFERMRAKFEGRPYREWLNEG